MDNKIQVILVGSGIFAFSFSGIKENDFNVPVVFAEPRKQVKSLLLRIIKKYILAQKSIE